MARTALPTGRLAVAWQGRRAGNRASPYRSPTRCIFAVPISTELGVSSFSAGTWPATLTCISVNDNLFFERNKTGRKNRGAMSRMRWRPRRQPSGLIGPAKTVSSARAFLRIVNKSEYRIIVERDSIVNRRPGYLIQNPPGCVCLQCLQTEVPISPGVSVRHLSPDFASKGYSSTIGLAMQDALVLQLVVLEGLQH